MNSSCFITFSLLVFLSLVVNNIQCAPTYNGELSLKDFPRFRCVSKAVTFLLLELTVPESYRDRLTNLTLKVGYKLSNETSWTNKTIPTNYFTDYTTKYSNENLTSYFVLLQELSPSVDYLFTMIATYSDGSILIPNDVHVTTASEPVYEILKETIVDTTDIPETN